MQIDNGTIGATVNNVLYQGIGPDSGEVTDITIDPSGTTDQTIYIATNDGGIWRSLNAGLSWQPKTDNQPSLSMGAVVIDPTNPANVYAGTGNNFDGGTNFTKGTGIYTSTDKGDHWSVVGGSVLAGRMIVRIVMPATQVLDVATDSGLHHSIDGGLHFGNNSPSFDNGTPVLAGYISDLHTDTVTPTTVYAAVNGTGIFRSTDGGATFPTQVLSVTCGLVSPNCFIAFTQSTTPNNDTMYANIETGTYTDPFTGKVTLKADVFKGSLSTGGTWPRIYGTNDCQCNYDQTIGVDPQDANRLYVGWQQLWETIDGGLTWSANSVTTNQVHWDHHALVFSPRSHWSATPPTRLYVGTDGGIATSADGGTSWTNINNGISTNLLNAIDIGRGSVANNAYSIGVAQDTGTSERFPTYSGTDWHLSIDGDGGAVAVDQTNASHVYSSDNGVFIESNDGGKTWPIQDFINTPRLLPNGVYRFAVDPNSGMNAWVGSANNNGFKPGPYLYRTNNGGTTFQAVCNFSTIANITWLATTKADSNTLWAGLDNGQVYRTHAAIAGPCPGDWQGFIVPGAPNNRVTAIAIDPIDSHVVVVTYAGFCAATCPTGTRTRHAFRSQDDGLTWTDISGTDGGTQNLPDLPVHAAVIDPGTTPHSIIVSNDAAVLRSLDTGATWQILGTGLPTVDSTSLALDPTANPALLRLGTYGRSSFELTSAQVPGLPTGVSASAGNASAIVSWTAPSSNGGSPVTGYRLTPYIGTTAQAGVVFNSTATSQNLTGLANGTTYTFTVAAINAVGTGPDSSASNPVTPLPPPTSAASTQQYTLANSDGVTWTDMDASTLKLTITPSFNAQALLSANSDLWTANPGYNQDIGIDVNGTIAAWKESGGFAGTFSPNAAMVQTVFPMTAGTTYTVKLRWKANKAASGATIYAGAGPISGQYSPTRLTAELLPAGSNPFSAVSTQQYSLAGSDGSTWTDMDATNLKVSFTPAVSGYAFLSGNSDLWTASPGYNQDLGIDVNGSVAAWKESGGFAGTFSPNAAMVQTVLPVTAAITYTAKLRWKTNKPASGAAIYAGAGPIAGQYSPTRLTVQLVPAAGTATAVSNRQYTLANSDGITWVDMDTSSATPLVLTITPAVTSTAILSGNADLWTANPGYNQDIGIDVNGTIVSWKESGGFAGTFSPNAAMVETVFPMAAGTTYTVKLRWKANKSASGATIYAGAGPIGTQYSPTGLAALLIPS